MPSPTRGPEDYFQPGDWNLICSMCGTKGKMSQMVQNWQGMWRHVRCNEPRHPQDFVHALNSQEMVVPVVQKMGEGDVLFCALNDISAVPGVALPGCMLPGNPNWDSSTWAPGSPIPGGPTVLVEDSGQAITTGGGQPIRV